MGQINNFRLDIKLASTYNSHSQKIRVMSEHWVAQNLFCPCCGNQHLLHQRNNSPVGDFVCERCGEEFELKSKERNFGRKVADGAYTTMIKRITSQNNPHLLILCYSDEYMVNNLAFIPNFFFVPSIIEKRKPLAETARRAGWTGCNILIHEIPKQGKINVIENRVVRDIPDVVNEYQLTVELQKSNIDARGWLYDVLNCVNKTPREIFKLSDIYKFIPYLEERHKNNKNIEAKIRQQLQLLHDKGFIEKIARGIYKRK